VTTNPNTSTKLEQRLFEYICLIQGSGMMYFFIHRMVYFGWSLLALIDLIIALLGFGFALLSYYKDMFDYLRYPVIFILYATSTYYWVALDGLYGSAGIGAVAVGLASVVISKSSGNLISLILSLALVISLVLIQVFTDWISEPLYIESKPVNYLIFFSAILMLIYYVKSEYDKERLKSANQNRRLSSLNDTLKATVAEKEAYIDELNQTKDQLIESEKMASVGRLTAGLAHELNNPLNFVGGNIKPVWDDFDELKKSLPENEYLKNKHIFDEIEELLSNIQEGSKRASSIIDNLLKISPRAQNEQQSLIDLEDLTRRTILLFKNVFGKVTIDLKADQKISFVGNSVEINQVLMNLIKNAIDSTNGQKERNITVVLTKAFNYCTIDIQDNGPGIPKENINKIFDPFFTTKKQGEGTGLGLYISYGIIKKHGGELSVIPSEGGACFRISLPLFSKQKGSQND